VLNLTISSEALRRFYAVIAVVQTVSLAIFAYFKTRQWEVTGRSSDQVGFLATQFDFQGEGSVFAVWFSSGLLLLLAIASLVNYWNDHSARNGNDQKWRWGRYGWLFLSLGSLYLSIDETIILHEGSIQWMSATFGVAINGSADLAENFGWVFLLGPVFLIAALFLLSFFVYWLSRVPLARNMAIFGTCCWAAVPLLEVTEERLVGIFGHRGVVWEQFAEESIETIGTLLLLVAALEYLIGISTAASSLSQAKPISSRRKVALAASFAPLALVLLIVMGIVVSPVSRGPLASPAYVLSADRVAYFMDTVDARGHSLLLSDVCDSDSLEAAFPYRINLRGSLFEFPDGGDRDIDAWRTLNVLRLTPQSAESTRQLEAGLIRAATFSRELWFLRTDSPTATDLFVEQWLTKNFREIETIWLPGSPSLRLTRVAPTVPFALAEPQDPLSAPAIFGNDDIKLVGYDWNIDQSGDKSILRVMLYWQAQKAINSEFHVFIHVLDPAGKLVAQSDGVPAYDRYQTYDWKSGEVVVDCHDIALPADLRGADMQVLTGLYTFPGGMRLPVSGSDHIQVKLSGETAKP
jgi:hypothetical protein